MALPETTAMRPARDAFERYYTEKMWEWIPAIYRHEDGLADNPGVLRAIVEIMARQAAVARRSIDRLWEDEFIDFCDDWAVSYIGDLVGTRLVHALNRRGRRVDVAKTLFYRRRKGTPVVMEALIRDITSWDGVVVESFRRLARSRHRLDPEPGGLEGPVTFSPPGGWADLRRPRGADLVDGPFDEYSHTPDLRQLRGLEGRYNIPKLNFHLFRLRAFEVELATPTDLGERRFTFDPSGRDIPLFRPSRRPGSGGCGKVEEWQLPAPLSCRLLGSASYAFRGGSVPPALAALLSPLAGQHFVDESRLRRTLLTLLTPATLDANIGALLAATITSDSPKLHLIPGAVAVLVGVDSGEPAVPHEAVLSGDLEDWGASQTPPADKRLVIDPERGRFLLLEDPGPGETVFVSRYHYGFSGPVGAGTYDRRRSVAVEGLTDLPGGAQAGDGDDLDPGPIGGFALPTDGVHQFVNSKTYVPDAPPGNIVDGVIQLCLQARNPERPYLKLVPAGGGAEWTFSALPKPPGFDPEDEANRRLLSMEGLWIGIVPSSLTPQVLTTPGEACAPVVSRLVLDGVFDRVEIRHSTLDPGGEQARLEPLECLPIPFVVLEIRGQVEELLIESAILGPVHESTSETDPCSIGTITIRDSIVQSLVADEPALATRIGEVHLERSTVFGDVVVNRLYASEALVQGVVRVTDNQRGCFRFSAASGGASSRLPPQFESHVFADGIPNHFFVSRRFGDAGYAQLSETAAEVVVRGAENGSEMGAFSSLFGPIKLDDLRAKVAEFMPFGLIAQFLRET